MARFELVGAARNDHSRAVQFGDLNAEQRNTTGALRPAPSRRRARDRARQARTMPLAQRTARWRRMPVPGVLGVVATAVSAALATVAAHWAQTIAAAAALVLLLVWIVLYTQVSAAINRQLTAAAEAGHTLPNGRALQAKWDRIIGARAMLQGLAVAALCVVLMI
jgi:hypothetical protein